MKHIIGILSLFLSVCFWEGCTGQQASPSVSGKDTVRVDSMPLDTALGDLLYEYFGGDVCAGGVRRSCLLLMGHQQHSGDGFFRLTCHADTAMSVFQGRRYTLRGTLEDGNATVTQLVPAGSAVVFNFLCVGDSLLVQLSDSCGSLPDTFSLKRKHVETIDVKDKIKRRL